MSLQYEYYRTIAHAQENELKLFDVTQATTSDTFMQFWKIPYIHGKPIFMIIANIDNNFNHSEDKISCLGHSNQLLGVGLENGTLMVYNCNFGMQHLTQSYIVFNDLVS